MKYLYNRYLAAILFTLLIFSAFSLKAQTVSTFVNSLSLPIGIAFDSSGNLFVANTWGNSINKITSDGSISTFINAGLNSPTGLVFDKAGNLYTTNSNYYRQYNSGSIVKITSSGTMTTLVGSRINSPGPIAVDTSGNLYVINYAFGGGNNFVYKVNSKGVVHPFVSTGLNNPQGIVCDVSGNVYIANAGTTGSNSILKVTSKGVVSPYGGQGINYPSALAINKNGSLYVAGLDANGNSCISIISSTGDIYSYVNLWIYEDSTSVATSKESQMGLALDNAANLYISNYSNNSITKVTRSGVFSTFYNSVLNDISSTSPNSLAFDASNNLFATGGSAIIEVNSSGAVSNYINAIVPSPQVFAFDRLGNLFVAKDSSIIEITNVGDSSTFISSGINAPNAIACDVIGNLYVVNGDNTIIKVTNAGRVSTFVSTGLIDPNAIAIDSLGNLYVTNYDVNYNSIISKVTTDGTVSTFVSAGLNEADGLAFDAFGNLYVSNLGDNIISRVSPDGMINPIVDTGLSSPGALAFDTNGSLYVVNHQFNTISKITIPSSSSRLLPVVTSFNPYIASSGTTITINGKNFTGAIAVDFGDSLAASFTVINDSTIAAVLGGGMSGTVSVLSSNGTGSLAWFTYCWPVQPTITITASATSIVTDTTITFTESDSIANMQPIFQWYKNGAAINGATAGNICTTSGLTNNDSVWAVATNIFSCSLTPTSSNKITMYVSNSPIYTVAGSGTAGYSGDGGNADAAKCTSPTAVVVDTFGNLYISDAGNNVIRKVSKSGGITTVVGNGTGGYTGDGGQATLATLNNPTGIAIDNTGNLYISDAGNNVIRMVNTAGIITTIAGNGTIGHTGDGGQATSASLNTPGQIAIDSLGNLYIADISNNAIRKVTSNGIINTIAGNDSAGYTGDGGLATSASLNSPLGVAVDAQGNIYIADYGNHVVRKINPQGIITTIAGNGTLSYGGDGGGATLAGLSSPTSVTLDAAGNIFIADIWNNVVRRVNPNGIINTVVGNHQAINNYFGDGSAAIAAGLYEPINVAFDNNGSMYIADNGNNVIREVTDVYALPVTLTSFTANAYNKTIHTNWQTANELSTHHFIVQHCTDGYSFTDIGNVKAIGEGANKYGFIDNNPDNGINYYRLKSVDKDGATSFSKVVSVLLTINDSRFTVYPNPAKDYVTIKGCNIASVQVIDNMGRVVKVLSLMDATNPTLSVNNLPAGVYHLRIQTTNGKESSAAIVVSY